MENGLWLVPNPTVPHHPAHRTPYREVSVCMGCDILAIWQRDILNCSTHLKNALYKNPEMEKLPVLFYFIFVEKGEATTHYHLRRPDDERLPFHTGKCCRNSCQGIYLHFSSPLHEKRGKQSATKVHTSNGRGADKRFHKIKIKTWGNDQKILKKDVNENEKISSKNRGTGRK
jgi:hypothetical protein